MLDHLITPNMYMFQEEHYIAQTISRPAEKIRKIGKVTNLLKSIMHPIRLSIVEVLNRRNELDLADICDILSLRESSVMLHLSKMQDSGIIKIRKAGKNIHYSLANKNTSQILGYIN
jgi:DNA-binding transcriptional ArsR family regulator